LIDKYGADALRLGVISNAPLGHDIFYDEKDVELGRNFCTKIWNAVRLRQMHAEKGTEIDPKLLTSDDRWILYALDQAIEGASRSLDKYEFAGASLQLQGFFWHDFCDWYLEAAKVRLATADVARKANALAVIDFVLEHALRLLHPIAPFITEELWHSLGFASGAKKTVQYADWPRSLTKVQKRRFALSRENARATAARYAFVKQMRYVRQQHNIPSNKKIDAVFHHVNRGTTDDDWDVIRYLSGISSVEFVADYHPAKGEPAIPAPFGGKLFLPLAIDVSTEQKRIDKEIAKVEEELRTVEEKLKNKSFVDRAPKQVVEQHRQRQKTFAEQLGKLKEARDKL
jgi:valyl-tRNA synthetase